MRLSLPVPIPILKMVRVLCFPVPCFSVGEGMSEYWFQRQSGLVCPPFPAFPDPNSQKRSLHDPSIDDDGSKTSFPAVGSTLNMKIR